MCELGIASTFHPGRKIGEDPGVIPAWPPIAGDFISTLAAWLDAHSLDLYPDRRGDVFSPIRFCYGRPRRPLVAASDIVCLHWIAGSFLHPRHLAALGRPLVWRLSDLWPFTGGCHFPGPCRKFEERCGACPSLGSTVADDLAARGFAARERHYRALDLTIAAPSRWIAEQAQRSKLFRGRRIVHIPTGVDVARFRPMPRTEARRLLDLPLDGPMLLFGAMDSTTNDRKGFAPLRRALGRFTRSRSARGAVAVVFGGETDAAKDAEGLPLIHVGRISDEERLARLYAAADVLIAPFIEDNLPNVVLEALACATPVVAFSAGGIPDAVEHQRNGVLVPVGDGDALAEGIAWALDPVRKPALAAAARTTALSRFDIAQCARAYRDLFAEVLAERAAARPSTTSEPPRTTLG
ncbi:MAG: glycosyltransferase [Xanthobacteraceae bacterium]|nr:glycosyltransferase [Xanthobacteraceae bacterium]